MTSQAPTIFPLQAPKDISINEIEAELRQIWQSYGIAGEDGALPAATRATTFTLVVYEPEETQYLLSALGFYTGPMDGILGPQMSAGLRQVQVKYGLPETGTATPSLSCVRSLPSVKVLGLQEKLLLIISVPLILPSRMKSPSVIPAVSLLCFPWLGKMKE